MQLVLGLHCLHLHRPLCPPCLRQTWFHGLGNDEEPNPVFRQALQAGLIDAEPEGTLQRRPSLGVCPKLLLQLSCCILPPDCPPLACNPPSPDAGEQWWSSQFLLPGASQPLSKEQEAAVTHTLAAWGAAVEELAPDARGTTADHLREAWAQVRWQRGLPLLCSRQGAWLVCCSRAASHTECAASLSAPLLPRRPQLLASGRLHAEQLELAQRVWRWREQLQRAMDGCHSTSDQRCSWRPFWPVRSWPGLCLRSHLPAVACARCDLLACCCAHASRLHARIPHCAAPRGTRSMMRCPAE